MLKPVDLRMRENLKTTFTSEFQAWGDMLQKGRMVLRYGKFKPSGQTLPLKHNIILYTFEYIIIYILYIYIYTSSTAQGGCGSFKNRKPIGEIGCCESGMAERSH